MSEKSLRAALLGIVARSRRDPPGVCGDDLEPLSADRVGGHRGPAVGARPGGRGSRRRQPRGASRGRRGSADRRLPGRARRLRNARGPALRSDDAGRARDDLRSRRRRVAALSVARPLLGRNRGRAGLDGVPGRAGGRARRVPPAPGRNVRLRRTGIREVGFRRPHRRLPGQRGGPGSALVLRRRRAAGGPHRDGRTLLSFGGADGDHRAQAGGRARRNGLGAPEQVSGPELQSRRLRPERPRDLGRDTLRGHERRVRTGPLSPPRARRGPRLDRRRRQRSLRLDHDPHAARRGRRLVAREPAAGELPAGDGPVPFRQGGLGRHRVALGPVLGRLLVGWPLRRRLRGDPGQRNLPPELLGPVRHGARDRAQRRLPPHALLLAADRPLLQRRERLLLGPDGEPGRGQRHDHELLPPSRVELRLAQVPPALHRRADAAGDQLGRLPDRRPRHSSTFRRRIRSSTSSRPLPPTA